MKQNNLILNVHIFRLFSLLILGSMLFLNSCELVNQDFNADAGPDQTVDFGLEVFLSGSDSYTGNNTLDYEWTLISAPTTSTFTISSPNLQNFSFIPDELGVYEFELKITESSDNVETDFVVITVIKAPVLVNQTINDDLVWADVYDDSADPDYKVNGCLEVNAKLTIEKGVLVVFEDNACISIGANGSIVAIGTSDEPITLTGLQKITGFWRGVEVKSKNPNNELKYVTIEYAGSGGFDGSDLSSNLAVNGGTIKVSNSTLRFGKGHGLITRREEDQLPNFTNNILSDNKYPVLTTVKHYHYFDGTSDYTGNTNDYIDTHQFWPLDTDVSWKKLNVPVLFVSGISSIESDLIIEKGAQFIGQNNSGIIVKASGSLQAIGTAMDMISFRGVNSVRGDWKGINFESNSPKNELIFVEVSDGGHSSFDGAALLNNVLVNDNARLKITNSLFRNCAGYGLMVRTDNSVLSDFSNNTITENEKTIICTIAHLSYFDSASDLTGNDEDGIFTYWAGGLTSKDVTWRKTTAPYKLGNWHKIDSDITIEPGVEIVGLAGSGLQINSNGSFNAIGTDTEPIIFRGEEAVPGYWKGISVQSNSALNILDYCQISDGGTGPFDGSIWKINLEVRSQTNGGMLTLKNSHISNSSGYGVVVGMNNTEFSEQNNTFSNNALGDIHYE